MSCCSSEFFEIIFFPKSTSENVKVPFFNCVVIETPNNYGTLINILRAKDGSKKLTRSSKQMTTCDAASAAAANENH